MNKYAHLAPKKAPTENRRCVTKLRFHSAEHAASAAERLSQKHGVQLYTYQCPMCLKWHTTRTPQ